MENTLDWTDQKFPASTQKTGEQNFQLRGTEWELRDMNGFAPTQSDGDHQYMPVFIVFEFGYYISQNWSGVGPSSKAYTMKAMIREDGKLCRPDTDKGERGFRPAMVHNSDWAVPYLQALQVAQ